MITAYLEKAGCVVPTVPLRRRVRTVLIGLIAMLIGMAPAAAADTRPAEATVADGSTAVARARVAADVLMSSYDPVKAWFPSSWWNSAVSLQTIGDYMQRTGDRRYLPQLDRTFEQNKGTFPAGELSSDELWGNFTSRAIDHGEWWALNWIQAYDLTGDRKYLRMAVTIAEFTYEYWDSTCGGGVWWDGERTYKNAVTNGQFIRLTAELHNRIPGDKLWLARSQSAWDWFVGSGMINSSNLVNDGLNKDCRNNGQNVYTYNQGLAIGAALELWRATGDPELLSTARRLADAAIDGGLTVDGVLTEVCDAPDRSCSDNSKQFKGIFLRYLMDLADTTGEARYRAFVATQAATIWERDRDAADRLGARWAGGTTTEHPNAFDWRTQASALSALIADIPVPAPKHSLGATTSPAQPVVMPASTGTTKVQATIGVSVTGPASEPVTARVTVEAPDGWTVSPSSGEITLNPRGSAHPVSGTFPVEVTVPATAENGHHDVSATVTAAPGLSFSTRSDVLVAHQVDFDTGTVDERPWLWDADGSQSNGVQNRFADGNRYFVYKFPFPNDTTTARATVTIDNEYVVDVSPDGEHWTTVLREERRITDGSNKADQVIDLTPYLGPDKATYLRVSDSYPDDGWGGRVYHVTATAD
ncbi:glycoside hydrolase family 76 protein [Actinopolymorpha sp. B17G11]|uniref:glycoside hydrolase family 76 protein n=1 Tax=Actinopolymorpha sp. B17G11 TaxID=3160861 RepID=UPI0032E41D5E